MINIKKFFTPIKSMDVKSAKKFLSEHKEGSFTLLDVRQPGEYGQEHLPGSKLIPVAELAQRKNELDPNKPVLVYWAVGGRSRVAAQMLSGMGFEKIYNLQGGIKAWQGEKAAGPVELNNDLIRGDETPGEMTVFVYSMEKELQTFYAAISQRSSDQQLKDLLKKLTDIEENHKKMIFELRKQINPPPESIEAFELEITGGILEGGFDINTFMEKNAPYMNTVPDVLNLAMMLETQGMDLYLRFADRSTHAQTKAVLFKIAEDEKAHLAALGRLLEEKI